MNHQPAWRRWMQSLLQPEVNPALSELLRQQKETLPVLWLLGKTGAGKSSIVQRLTGDTRAQIGNGYAPCTDSAVYYDYPATLPVMRFLDTRGLGEAHYDPADDLAVARKGSHALLILTRVDDTSQAALLGALGSLQLQPADAAILHVHTALQTLDMESRERAISFNSNQVIQALGRKPKTVHIDFTDVEDGFDDPDQGINELRTAIIDMVPELSLVLSRHAASNNEEALYLDNRKEILAYASAAAAADVFPAVGLFAVPTLQGKLLHALAGRYDIGWDKRTAAEFVSALGSGFLYRYALSLGARQIAKLIPVYGQTAGAAAAASVSFASTYAIGRAACLYLYRKKNKEAVHSDALREAFQNAFKEQRKR